MATENIITCDACGKRESDLDNHHWTNRICKVKVSLKEHTSVQSEPFIGHLCASCGHGLCAAVTAYIESRKSESAPEGTKP